MAYYRHIRDMREDHDLTQRQLAALLQMPQPQYNRYEQGIRDFPTDVLIHLAGIFDTSIDYLLGLTDDPTPYRQKR
ncbi:MAG: helix-turn-helix transcriptional regulator [Gemmiger sp.]|nr:helix-turn-helix transcriptional regulator [Gemmiger sp.]